MSWFRKKGKYWYFVEIKREYDKDTLQQISRKEVQHYIGDDQAVISKLLPSPSKNITPKSDTPSRRKEKLAAARPGKDIRTVKLPKKKIIFDLKIERCSPGCHAYDMGNRYLHGYSAIAVPGGNAGGGGGPAKNKEQIISSIKRSIQSSKKFNNADQVRIRKLIDKSGLKFTKEDFLTA